MPPIPKPEIFCLGCKWLVEPSTCMHESNIEEVRISTWLCVKIIRKFISDPVAINQNNDCSNFEELP
jgi:hypothetical protein